ncbi:MAG: hypothetical protein V4801_05320 [Burkholderia gladioli]
MSAPGAVTVASLIAALERDDESCWALYEEIGRIAAARWLKHDRVALMEVACAWVKSVDAQGALADSWPDASDHREIEQRAEAADADLFARIEAAL